MGMMGKVQELQAKMQSLQDELAETTVSGQAGGGMVTATLTLKGELREVRVDPSLLVADEREILEDLVVAAHADAKSKADRLAQEKTAELTAGLPLPPGMKMPF